MDSLHTQEEQAPNPYRGCQIGACFACGLGGGKSKLIEWQNRRPNPLPMFVFANDFYTPMLLPGMYLPFEFVSSEISDTTPFHTMDDPELARYVAAFLDHETVHRHLLAGVVPMVMRLLASRCYRQLALLTKRFHPSSWESILLQSKNIEDFYCAIAPLQEVVANLRNMVLLKDDPYALDVGEQSLDTYKMAYGKGFEKVLNDFRYITKSLKEWFAPCPIEPFTIYILTEYMLMGAIDEKEVRADLFTSPILIPKRRLSRRLAQVGMPYFVLEKQPPIYSWHSFAYTAHDVTGRLEEIKSGIQNAKFTRSKKPLRTEFEQLMHIAKAIPRFHKWLQGRDKIAWLKRRVLDGISEIQDMIKGMGFDLPLVEVWQSDISPYIK